MSTRSFEANRSAAEWIRATLIAFSVLLIAVPLIPTSASAQSYDPSGGGGYGMMGGGGMMGGFGAQGQQQLTLAESMQFIEQSTAAARVNKTSNMAIFSGDRVFIAMAAVQPGFPDTTFEVAGLVDPTIEVPAGAAVTVLLINMDYGPDMDHGVVITDVPPPYPVMSMMGAGSGFAGVQVLPPRTGSNAKTSEYSAESVTFTAPQSPGTYYYLCQYYDHASKGMFGRFIVK